MSILRRALDADGTGSGGGNLTAAIDAAEAALGAAAARADAHSSALWTELRVWAEALFQSLHQQFSVPLYGGEYTRRGNTLDTARMPLSDAPYMRAALTAARAAPAEDARRAALAALAEWAVVGAGSFYDDMGELAPRAPHYMANVNLTAQTGDQALGAYPVLAMSSSSEQYYQPTGDKSAAPPALPADRRRAQLTFVRSEAKLPPTWAPNTTAASASGQRRVGSMKFAGPQSPIALTYRALPAGAAYAVSATGLESKTRFNVTANGVIACAGQVGPGDDPDKVWSCDVPAALTSAGGDLTVAFTSDCCVMQLAEVWLRRRQDNNDH